MSGAVAFDTLKFAERLEAGGFTHAQAKAAAEAFAEATGEELATKADVTGARAGLTVEIAAARTELKAEIGALRSELKMEIGAGRTEFKTEVGAGRSELKAETAGIRGELRELQLRMTIKLGGLIMAATGIILAAFKFMK